MWSQARVMILWTWLLALNVQPLKVVLHMDFGSPSHIKPLLEVGTVLHKRNHTVIFAASQAHKGFHTGYPFSFISLGNKDEDSKSARQFMQQFYGKRREVDEFKVLPLFLEKTYISSYEFVYPRLGNLIDIEKPDAIACDFFSPACREVALMKGIPLITGVQSVDGFSIVNTPFITFSPSYGSITTDELGFFRRFKDKIIDPLIFSYHFSQVAKAVNKIREKYNVPPTTTHLGDLKNSLTLANTFIGFEAAAPIPPNIKLIGPVKSDIFDPLPPELESFINTHPRILYIGFGSQVMLADFDIANLLEGSLGALKEGSIDGIIWGLGRTRLEEFPPTLQFNDITITSSQLSKHPHVRLLNWAPQAAILEHKHTRLFISHGGLESAFEAILSGTPVLCMPFLGDQPRNARKLEDAGIGKYVNRLTVTPNSLSSDIYHMLNDTTGGIVANIQRMQTLALMGSRRKEVAADAIEEYIYTAQACRPYQKYAYGQIPCEVKHLIMASNHMSFIKANLLDVYLLTGMCILAPIILILYLMSWFFCASNGINHPKSKQKVQ